MSHNGRKLVNVLNVIGRSERLLMTILKKIENDVTFLKTENKLLLKLTKIQLKICFEILLGYRKMDQKLVLHLCLKFPKHISSSFSYSKTSYQIDAGLYLEELVLINDYYEEISRCTTRTECRAKSGIRKERKG